MRIDQEFKSLIHPLTSEEYKQLEENIVQEGCRDSLVTWEDILIDGHNRYEICSRNNIKFNTVAKEFKNREEVIEWIIRNQFGRRNLSLYEKGKLALRLEETIKAMARENQKGGQGGVLLPQKSAKAIESREELAKIAGVSHDTIDKIKVIEREASPEQKSELLRGTKKINTVYKELRTEENENKPETMKVCTVCGLSKPLSHYGKNSVKCKECAAFISRTDTDAKTVREKIKQFSDVDVDAMYAEMKKAPSEEDTQNDTYISIKSEFKEILNRFDTEINKFIYMKFAFENDKSSKPKIEKLITNLQKIMNLMEE